jgi:GT2 family glycosyltransferase
VTDVAVVVVTHNSASHLDALLASLDGAMGGCRTRLLAVDNASTDDTLVRLRADGRAEVFARPDNRGYAAAINFAVDRTREASAVLVLNPDLMLGVGSIPTLLRAAGESRVGIVVPQLRGPDGSIYHSLRREPTVRRALGAAVMGGRFAQRFPQLCETVGDECAYHERRDVDWATGAAMLVTRQCLDVTGPWDESYFLYSEETDFAERSRRAGFRVLFEPDAVVTHTGGQSLTSPRLRTMLVLNRIRYFRRRHGQMRSAAFYSAVLWDEFVRGLLGDRAACTAALTLVQPSARPTELKCSERLIPR